MYVSDEDIKRRIVIAGYLIVAVFLLFSLRLWQLQILKGKEYYAMSEANRLKVLKVAAPRGIIYDRNGRALVKNMPFYSASLIPGAAMNIDLEALSRLLSMSVDDLRERISVEVAPFESVKLKEGIPFDEVAYIEARRSDFPGLFVEPDITRYYVYGDVASHVVGYLGMQGPDKLQSFKDSEIPPDAFIGKRGVEALYDDVLRGTPGKRYIEVDALGRQLRIVREERPVKGDDLTISIDIDVQQKMEETFRGRTGAAVALEPKTGEMLALVSRPSYNPNLFSRGISAEDWKSLNENPYHPFLNRAVQSHFPPGSVFKTVVAAAALEEEILPPDFKVNCKGVIYHGRWSYRCWKRGGHGVVDIHRAIVESCDIFFYEVGKLLGINKIAEYARKLGLGQPTGIVFPGEKAGFIPTEKWKLRTRKEPWFIGETYHSAIGQGYVLTSPLQLGVLISSFANGGHIVTPKIIKGSEDETDMRETGLRSSTLDTITDGLRGVVNEPHGTGAASRLKRFTVAGKTGTAQVIRQKDNTRQVKDERFQDHAWFVAYAPFENPEIAVSVFVEHGGHGGSAAAPIARAGIEAYLDKKYPEVEKIKSTPGIEPAAPAQETPPVTVPPPVTAPGVTAPAIGNRGPEEESIPADPTESAAQPGSITETVESMDTEEKPPAGNSTETAAPSEGATDVSENGNTGDGTLLPPAMEPEATEGTEQHAN